MTCGSAAECPNAGYACGVDHRCHAPGGQLAPGTTPALDLVDEVRISDLDGDGIGDVLGVSSSAIDVRFGDAQAALVSRLAIVTPAQSGPPAFGDLDGDGVLDLAVATPDGVVAYTSELAVLAPAVSFFPLDGSGGTARDVFPAATFAFGVIAEDAASHRLVAVLSPVDDVGFPDKPEGVPLCGLSSAGFDPSGVDAVTLPRNGDGSTDMVLSVFTGGPPGANLCVLAIHFDPVPFLGKTRTPHFYAITPSSPTVTTKPVWVDLDFDAAGLSDHCPALVDGDGGPVLTQWDGSLTGLGGSHCGLAASSAVAAANASPGAHVIGRIPVEPPSLVFPNDVLVMSDGLYINTFLGMLLVYRSERTLTGVASGDLDGDGATDAVLRADASGLDVVYRSDQNNAAGYIVQRVGTTGTVTSAQIGDFDGNGYGDIAYTEALIGHAGLTVAYSDPGHTLTAIQQGAFAALRAVTTVLAPDSSDPSARIADLVVLEDLGTQLAATLLDGSPQRAMISYFEPRGGADPRAGEPFRQVVVGRFEPGSSPASYRDLVAFVPDSADKQADPTSATAYRLDGTANGLDPSDPINSALGQRVTGLGDCATGPAAAPCLQSAVLTAWPTSADHDLIIGIDKQTPPHAFLLDPFGFTGGDVAPIALAALTASVPAGAVVQTVRVVDLDGDGAPELVVAFAPPGEDAPPDLGLVEVCTMSAAGLPIACTDVAPAVAAVEPGVAACIDAAPGHLAAGGPAVTPSGHPDLVILCHDASGDAVLARLDASGGTPAATIIAAALGAVRQIGVGDVTGDGVDDVVVLRGTGAARTVAVFAQCTSHDRACAAGAVQP